MALAKRLDRLGAVNLLLAGAGEQYVSTLVDDGINDTDLAQQILDETTIEVLSAGWDFNKVKKTMIPDSTDRIAISTNYLRVEGTGDDYRRRLTVRGNYLYDLDNDTNLFTETSVDLLVVQNLEFGDIPSPFQFYIARMAAVTYQAQTRADPDQDQILRVMADQAMQQARKYNSKSGNRSWIHDSRSTSRLIGERRVNYADDYSNSRPI